MRATAKVFSVNFLNRVMTGLMGLVLIRHMLPVEFGLFTLGLSAAYLSNQIAASSFNRIYLMSAYNLGEKSSHTSFFILQLAFALLVNILFLPLFGLPPKIILVSLLLSLTLSALEFVKSVYQKELQFGKFSVVDFTRTFLFISFIAIFVYGFHSEIQAWVVLLAQAITALVVIAAPLVFMVSRPHWADFAKALRLARTILGGHYILLFTYFGLIAIFGQIDIIMLKLIGGVDQVASYGAAFRYYALLAVGLNSLHTVLAPLVQDLKSQSAFTKLMRDYRRLAYGFIVLIGLAAILSAWLIPFIDKGKYPESINVFRVLSCAAVISLLYSPFSHVLIRLERFSFLVKLVSVAIVVDVIGSAILIPLIGPLGAAASLLLASTIVNYVTYRQALAESPQLFVAKAA